MPNNKTFFRTQPRLGEQPALVNLRHVDLIHARDPMESTSALFEIVLYSAYVDYEYTSFYASREQRDSALGRLETELLLQL